jgi:hypothetical protein
MESSYVYQNNKDIIIGIISFLFVPAICQISDKIVVGAGPKLFSLGGREYTDIVFNLFPVDGSTHWYGKESGIQKIFSLAMGVITQFLFLGLVYWLLERNKKWLETLIVHLIYHYAIKISFWLTFFLNFPFVLSSSDWTQITKIILGWN